MTVIYCDCYIGQELRHGYILYEVSELLVQVALVAHCI